MITKVIRWHIQIDANFTFFFLLNNIFQPLKGTTFMTFKEFQSPTMWHIWCSKHHCSFASLVCALILHPWALHFEMTFFTTMETPSSARWSLTTSIYNCFIKPLPIVKYIVWALEKFLVWVLFSLGDKQHSDTITTIYVAPAVDPRAIRPTVSLLVTHLANHNL